MEDDILFTIAGTIGRVAQVTSAVLPANINQAVAIVRPNRNAIYPRFLYYALRDSNRIQLAHSKVVQSVQANFSLGELSEIELPLPSQTEQRTIAHILSTLDDKIELNRKQNETLEAMARALFKAWFVDFEPVRAKLEGRWQRGQSLPGLPAHLYDLFPDRLVDSELGEIPEGWSIFAFGDVAQQGKGVVNPGDAPQDLFTHYSLPAFDSSHSPSIERGDAIKSNKTPVLDGAVLVSKLNPHIPRVWNVGTAGINAVCSTEFIVWIPKKPANSAFLYCLAASPEFNGAMRQLVTGTSNSHQRVKPDQLREIRVFHATENAIKVFSELVRSPLEQVLQNRHESRTLAQLRDTLLPKLISGELRIKDAEAFLKERG
jgi:type I restriction enzyme S subunit